MANVGSLTFEISANVARLQEDMAKAKSTVETTMKGIESAANVAKIALGALGVAASINGLKNMVTGAIDGIDALRQLSVRTGVAVEQLSALKGVAKLSGTDMDSVGAAVNKLEKNMLEFARGGVSKSANAFMDLGFSSKEAKAALEGGDITGFLQTLAKRMEETGNGAINAARAQEIMGKSGAQLLPFLKELAATGQLNAKVTTEQAEQAHLFNQNLIKLQAGSNQLKLALATELLPSLTEITTAMISAKKESGSLMALWVGLGGAASHALDGIQGFDKGKLKSVQTDITALQKAMQAIDNRPSTYRAANDRARVELQSQLNAKLSEEVQLANRIAAAEDEAARLRKPKSKAFDIPERPEKTGGAGGKSPYESELDALDKMAIKSEHVSQLQQEWQKIQMGMLGPVSAAQIAELEMRARIVDKNREDLEVKKQTADALQKMQVYADTVQHKEAELAKTLTEKYKNLIDPIEKYRKELIEIDSLLAKGKLTFGEWQEAGMKINDQIDAAAGLGKEIKKVDDASKEYFQRLASGFESSILGGKKFSDVLRGVAKDMLGIYVRQNITNPLANAFSSATSGGIGSLLGGIFGGGGTVSNAMHFANGGDFAVGGSGGTDSQLVQFMATPGEQVSVRTPGQAAGGGGVQIVQNLYCDARSDIGSIRTLMAQAKDAAVQEVAAMCMQGGSYASAVRGR